MIMSSDDGSEVALMFM